MEDPRLEFVYTDARAAIDRQASKLDELRARAASVLTAAAVGGGFLGSKAVGPPLRGPAAVGVVLSVITGLLAAGVLLPLRGWVFSRNPTDLLESYVDEPSAKDIDTVRRWATIHLGENFRSNERKLKVLAWLLSASVIALILEVTAFFVALSMEK